LLRENSMTRNRWPVVLAVVLGVALWAGSSMAQTGVTPTDYSLKAVGANDAQVTTVSTNWSWGMGLFGMQFQSWGRASARSWSGLSSVAVLRERRGLVR